MGLRPTHRRSNLLLLPSVNPSFLIHVGRTAGAASPWGWQVALRTELQFIPYYSAQALAGAHYLFHGLNFLTWLVPTPPPWPQVRDYYRHIGVLFKDGPNEADLTIDWPEGWRQSHDPDSPEST